MKFHETYIKDHQSTSTSSPSAHPSRMTHMPFGGYRNDMRRPELINALEESIVRFKAKRPGKCPSGDAKTIGK